MKNSRGWSLTPTFLPKTILLNLPRCETETLVVVTTGAREGMGAPLPLPPLPALDVLWSPESLEATRRKRHSWQTGQCCGFGKRNDKLATMLRVLYSSLELNQSRLVSDLRLPIRSLESKDQSRIPELPQLPTSKTSACLPLKSSGCTRQPNTAQHHSSWWHRELDRRVHAGFILSDWDRVVDETGGTLEGG